MAGSKLTSLKGQTFGYLTATGKIDVIDGYYKEKCICTCGKTKYVRRDALMSGRAKSCGCLSMQLRLDTMVQNKANQAAQDQYSLPQEEIVVGTLLPMPVKPMSEEQANTIIDLLNRINDKLSSIAASGVNIGGLLARLL